MTYPTDISLAPLRCVYYRTLVLIAYWRSDGVSLWLNHPDVVDDADRPHVALWLVLHARLRGIELTIPEAIRRIFGGCNET